MQWVYILYIKPVLGGNIMSDFHKLFKKHKEEEERSSSRRIILNPLVDHYIYEVASVLQIEIPNVKTVALLYESMASGRKLVYGVNVLNIDEIPTDAEYKAGYYDDKNDTIYISTKALVQDSAEVSSKYVNLTFQEQFYVLIHELRHVWQRKYYYSKYYGHNAVGLEYLHDPSEIDADAFAIAYYFSDKTPFGGKDLPTISNEILTQVVYDSKRRKEQVEVLTHEYGWTLKD